MNNAYLSEFQAVSTRIHLYGGFRKQSKLWLHELRHFRMGFTVSFSIDDARLLGKFISTSMISEVNKIHQNDVTIFLKILRKIVKLVTLFWQILVHDLVILFFKVSWP